MEDLSAVRDGTRRGSQARSGLSRFHALDPQGHELRLHAAEKGLEGPIHDALFKARFEDGADIGRVDVLVGLAAGLGLDLTETKAVLDVDRYADRVAELRRLAEAEGVERTPTVHIGSERLEGPLRIDDLRGLLEAARLV